MQHLRKNIRGMIYGRFCFQKSFMDYYGELPVKWGLIYDWPFFLFLFLFTESFYHSSKYLQKTKTGYWPFLQTHLNWKNNNRTWVYKLKLFEITVFVFILDKLLIKYWIILRHFSLNSEQSNLSFDITKLYTSHYFNCNYLVHLL